MTPPRATSQTASRTAPSLPSLLACAVAACAAALGCDAAPKYAFSVSLKNASEQPVTVWLTKTAGPEEADWLSPEALSGSRAARLDAVNGITIPAGRTGDIGPLEGRFAADSFAVLRVYGGQLTFDQLLATPADGKLRVDVLLREGANALTVSPRPPLRVTRDGDAPTDRPVGP